MIEDKQRTLEAPTWICPPTMEATGQHLLALKVMRVSVSNVRTDSCFSRLIRSVAR